MNQHKPKILVVDDDKGIRDTLTLILKKQHHVLTAPDGETALHLIDTNPVDVVLLDIQLPGINGLEVLERIKESQDQIEVIMITVLKDIETAVKAIKLGAYDYITKEFEYDTVENLVHRAIEKKTLLRKVFYLHSEIEQLIEQEFIIGQTERMKEVYAVINKTAELLTTVLIRGESGTGKELVARIIHRKSARAEKPFITVNMASVPEGLAESTLFGHERGAFTGAYKRHLGKFELANEGTLFLDEIGDLDINLQAKLLRAIQEGEIERVGGTQVIPIDIRLVTATRINLEEAVERGTFREDLFYRLNVIPVNLPPLRDRLVDVPDFVELFIDRYNKRFHKKIEGIEPEALEVFSEYSWPGNIRELENLIERMVALSEDLVIRQSDIPIEFLISGKEPALRRGLPLKEALETFERSLIIRALEGCQWHRAKTAKSLGISLSALKYKMKRLSIYGHLKKEETEDP
jgi:two-component system response regulator AtoC